jgi:hypothetical protein
VEEQGKIGGNLEKEKPQQLSYCRVSVRSLVGAKLINHKKKKKKKKDGRDREMIFCFQLTSSESET